MLAWGKMEGREGEKAVWIGILKQILSDQTFFLLLFFSTQNLHFGGLCLTVGNNKYGPCFLRAVMNYPSNLSRFKVILKKIQKNDGRIEN